MPLFRIIVLAAQGLQDFEDALLLRLMGAHKSALITVAP
jgi:hypothetical protein